MKKQCILSIIVPVYNTEEYLDRCLESVTQKGLEDAVEIIIVDDGSTDNSLRVAREWQKKHANISVIHKENGGHGSTINCGIAKASGKYLRVLDSDDWFDQKALVKLISILEKSSSDMILTNYSRCEVGKNPVEVSILPAEDKGLVEFDKLLAEQYKDKLIEVFSIHSITIKTDCIKKVWSDGLLEKTFYEDQEWVSKTIMAAQTIEYYPFSLYQYYLGREGQSMDRDKLFKNRSHHERVIRRIVELALNANGAKRAILINRLAKIVRTHYWIYFYHPNLQKKDREEFKSLKEYLLASVPECLEEIDLRYKTRLFIGRKRQEIRLKRKEQ